MEAKGTGILRPFGTGTTWPTDTPVDKIQVCGNLLGLSLNYVGTATDILYLGAGAIWDDKPVTYYTFLVTFSTLPTMALFQTQTKVFESTELGCYGEQFTFTCLKNGVSSPCPSNSIVIVSPTSLLTYSLNPTTFTDVGTWDITIIGTLTTLLPSPISAQFTFNVIITSDCVNTLLDSIKTINNMVVAVNGPTVTQDITWPDSIGTVTHSNQAWCGPRTYTIVGQPAFMTFTNPTVSLTTTNPLHVGPYTVTVTIGL